VVGEAELALLEVKLMVSITRVEGRGSRKNMGIKHRAVVWFNEVTKMICASSAVRGQIWVK